MQVPRLYLTWPTVGIHSNDQYALDLLANVLAGSRTARLTRLLAYEKQSAAAVSADQSTSEGVGEFQIVLTPRPGHSLRELEQATDAVIARVKQEGPTADELQKAKASEQLQFLRALESGEGKATTLATSSALTGDPGHFQVDYVKEQAVTASEVRRVANEYLTRGRVVLSVVPLGKREQASQPEASTVVGGSAHAESGMGAAGKAGSGTGTGAGTGAGK